MFQRKMIIMILNGNMILNKMKKGIKIKFVEEKQLVVHHRVITKKIIQNIDVKIKIINY